MKVLFTDFNGIELISDVTKVSMTANIQYRIKHKEYLGFQFSCFDRPQSYRLEDRLNLVFSGYLIGKKSIAHKEVKMKIIEL